MNRVGKKPAGLIEYALVMAEDDNVAIAKQRITAGSMLEYRGRTVTVSEETAAGQRFALIDIGEGEFVRQYGHPFAISKGIGEGWLISTANIEPYCQEFRGLSGKHASVREKRYLKEAPRPAMERLLKALKGKTGAWERGIIISLRLRRYAQATSLPSLRTSSAADGAAWR